MPIVLIFLGIAFLPAIIMCIAALKQYNDFEKDGIYATAVIVSNKVKSRGKTRQIYNTNGYNHYETIVRYKRNDGKEYESELWVGVAMPVGTEIKILYKEDNLKTVFAISNDNQTY